MKFSKLIDEYLDSPQFSKLSDHSKAMYAPKMEALRSIGGFMPLRDSDMWEPVAVARSRSRVAADKKRDGRAKLNETAKNLTQFWFHSIDNRQVDGDEISASSKNTLLTYLKVVYQFAITAGYLNVTENIARSIPTWKHVAAIGHPLTLDEVDAIYKAARDGTISEDLVPYAYWLVFLFDGGFRPSDTYNHRREWFTTRGKETFYQIIGGKRRSASNIELSLLIDRQKEILAWFDKMPVAGTIKFTFRTATGKPFERSWTSIKIAEVYAAMGLENRTIYDARRGLATAMYKEVKAGKRDFKTIKDRLRHIKRDTTERYIVQDPIKAASGYIPPAPVGG